MPCINDTIYYLVTYDPYDPQLITIDGSTGIQARNKDSFDYYYIQFSCHNSFRIFDIEKIIPADILSKIKNKEIFLVLDNGLEPFLKSADGIYHNLILNGKIPARQIIFMSSVPTMYQHVKFLSEQLNQEEINVEWYSMFEYQLWDVITNQLKTPLETLQIKRYEKKFINFNRRWRLHRPLMLILLNDKKLLNDGYISFGKSDFVNDTWESRWNELLRYYTNNKLILDILDNNKEVKNFPLMYLDTDDLVTNRAEQTDSTNSYYLNSYFSLVNETTFHTKAGYDSVPFFSEKIFKCIAMKHPFIIVTVPNSLKYLKELGYKTFDNIIDESYDQEIDDALRAIKITNEVERLCNLDEQKLENFLIESRKICDYNYNVMKKKTTFIRKMNGI
jgi:hypothetical protein